MKMTRTCFFYIYTTICIRIGLVYLLKIPTYILYRKSEPSFLRLLRVGVVHTKNICIPIICMMNDMDTIRILLCGICDNRLKNPRYLTCLHSFCEDCLESWIDKSFSQKDNGIKCKTCNTITEVCLEGNPSTNDLVEKLPRNNFVASLVEREKLTSAGERVVFCHPCSDGDGTKVKGSHWCQQCAEVLCANCANFHKKVKNLSSHKVYSLNDVKEHPEIITKAYEICEIHPEEKLETYCYSHDEPCCVRCLVSYHRHCEDTIPIDQWVRETQNALEPAELLQELERKSLDDTPDNTNVLKYLEINDKITTLRKEIDNHLNKLEKQLRSEVSMFMNTLKDDNGKEIINFSKLYLKTLIKNGTTVQLFTSMKKIRIVLANTEKREKKEESICVEFNENLENFKEIVQSFGHIVSQEKVIAKDYGIALNVPAIYENEKRPPIGVQNAYENNMERISPEHKQRKDHNDTLKPTPKTRTKIERRVDDTYKNQTDNEKDTMFPSNQLNPQPVGLVDNIAEIERKLKIFIDKHISLVTDGKEKEEEETIESEMEIEKQKDKGKGKTKRKVRTQVSFADDGQARYAKVKKDKKRNQNSNDHEQNSEQQMSVEQNKADVQFRRAANKTTKTKKTEALDPEKERLNALINNYLKKSEKKDNDNSLARTKSFYFSTPDIPSAIFEENNSGTAFYDNEASAEISRQRVRRNSLQAASMDGLKIDEPDYDEIDYDAPFLKSTYMSQKPTQNESKEALETSSTENLTSKLAANDDVFDRTSVKSVNNADFKIYSPQSQLKAAAALGEKSTILPEKGKSVQKKRFFEKAKEKFRFTKKNGKFNVEQSTKDKTFNDDPMNEPIYVGTPYEIPVKLATHEISTKPKKVGPYEENFQIIFPDKNDEKSNIDINQQRHTDITPSDINKHTATLSVEIDKQPVETNHEYLTLIDTKEDVFKLTQGNMAEEKNITDVSKEENHKTDTVASRRPSVQKAPMAGVSPSFLNELRQKLEVKKPEQKPEETDSVYFVELDDKDERPVHHEFGKTRNALPTSIKQTKNLGVNIFPGPQNLDHWTTDKPKSENRITTYEIKKQNDFNVQSGNTIITGGVFNKKDNLLLIDNGEQKLYIFTSRPECQDVLYFKDKPWDIATVNENVIAVTFPEAEAVDLVDISEMRVFKRLSVHESCYGLDFQNTNLIVRCSESIKIMNLHGTIMKSIRIRPVSNGYVACYDDKIYYTYKSALVCVDHSGNEIFTFKNPALEGAEGIGIDFEGNVYVAGLQSNNVWQVIGHDEKQHRQLIKKLQAPKLIVFRDSLNTFFVTYDFTNVVIYDLLSSYGSAV